MVERYKAGRDGPPGESSSRARPPVNASFFDEQRSDLEAYLHWLLLKTYDAEAYAKKASSLRQRFPDSPLFLYTALGVDPDLTLSLDCSILTRASGRKRKRIL